MTSIHKITGYPTSRDYDQLADQMQRHSIICIVDYGADCRDVAQTLWSPSIAGNGIWQVSARGIAYIHSPSRAHFIQECSRKNVEFIMPTSPS